MTYRTIILYPDLDPQPKPFNRRSALALLAASRIRLFRLFYLRHTGGLRLLLAPFQIGAQLGRETVLALIAGAFPVLAVLVHGLLSFPSINK